ncbi:MAG: hypothetical protein GC153_01435 [Alphaproteobacteria bacterium]|nr:hypothetical protein [Alphaproteobacteria bacterium]
MLALLFSIFLGALAFGAETGRCQYKKRKAEEGGYDGGDYAGNAAAAAPSLRANAAYPANPSLRIRAAR